MIYRSSFKKKKIYFHLAAKTSDGRMSEKQLKMLWDELPKRIRRHSFLELHACVLMSNHFHALFSATEMYFELAEGSLRAEFKNMYLGTTFKDNDFKMTRIQSFAAYREVYRYIYRNPVEAEIVPLAEMYDYSTLGEILGHYKNRFFANDNMGLIVNPYCILGWINKKTENNLVH